MILVFIHHQTNQFSGPTIPFHRDCSSTFPSCPFFLTLLDARSLPRSLLLLRMNARPFFSYDNNNVSTGSTRVCYCYRNCIENTFPIKAGLQLLLCGIVAICSRAIVVVVLPQPTPAPSPESASLSILFHSGSPLPFIEFKWVIRTHNSEQWKKYPSEGASFRSSLDGVVQAGYLSPVDGNVSW